MVLELHDVQEIDELTYHTVCWYAQSSSLPDLPRDPVYRRYLCSLEGLLAATTYPVWFTDPARQGFVNYDHEDATPITFAELVQIDHLREEKLSSLRRLVDFSAPLSLLVEHCSGCEVRVIKDGCKRLLQHALAPSATWVRIVEVSGHDWSGGRYDMTKICRCVDTT